MQATLVFVLGVLLGLVILIVTRRKKPSVGEPSPRGAWLQWLTLALGILAAAAFTVGITLAGGSGSLLFVSIGLAVVAVVLGVGGLLRGERRWPTWLGLVLGAAPAIFWVVFAAAEIVAARH